MPKKLTQEEFEHLLDDLKQKKPTPPETLSLASYLKDKGFEPTLEHINFFIPEKTVTMTPLKRADDTISSVTTVPRRTDILTYLDFSDCTISKCQFDECDLSNSIWPSKSIRECSYLNTVMDNSIIENVQFLQCHFEKSSVDGSKLNNVLFEQCKVISCSFNKLEQAHHIEFLNSLVQSVSLLGGKNIDVRLTNSKEKLSKSDAIEFITDQNIISSQEKKKTFNPTILVCWDNKTPLMSATFTEKMLLDYAMNPLRMNIMIKVNPEALDQEIIRLSQLTQEKMQEFKQLTEDIVATKMKKEEEENPSKPDIPLSRHDELFLEEWKKQKISFPLLMMQIMRDANAVNPAEFPEMEALYHYAKTFFDKVDGIILTGGQDIDPRFYGEQKHPTTGLPAHSSHPGLSDPRRDLLEFMLVYIQQRASHPKPLFGICRGSQVLAASYDATFYQELESPERRRYLVEKIEQNSPNTHAANYSTSKTLKQATEDEDMLEVIFQHHQGYSINTAHGFEEIAAKQTSGGPKITVVSEHLHQNITAVQAHIEYYVDKEEDENLGFAPHVSVRAADSIFGQFATRVQAYRQQLRISSAPSSFFTTTKDNEEQTNYSPTNKPFQK